MSDAGDDITTVNMQDMADSIMKEMRDNELRPVRAAFESVGGPMTAVVGVGIASASFRGALLEFMSAQELTTATIFCMFVAYAACAARMDKHLYFRMQMYKLGYPAMLLASFYLGSGWAENAAENSDKGRATKAVVRACLASLPCVAAARQGLAGDDPASLLGVYRPQ